MQARNGKFGIRLGQEMGGVKGPEEDCVDELTVLKVHLSVQCCVSLLHFKLDVFDFLSF